MSHSFRKNAFVLLMGVVAIGICVVGYKQSIASSLLSNNHKERQSASFQSEKLKQLQENYSTLFVSTKSGILGSAVTNEKINQWLREMEEIKNAGVSNDEMNQFEKQLNVVKEKLAIQTSLSQMYETPIDWTEYRENNQMKEEIQSEILQSVDKKIRGLPADEWQGIAIHYFSDLLKQKELLDDINHRLSVMYKNGIVTTFGTKNEFIHLSNELDQVKSQTIRAKYVTILNHINDQRGFGVTVW